MRVVDEVTTCFQRLVPYIKMAEKVGWRGNGGKWKVQGWEDVADREARNNAGCSPQGLLRFPMCRFTSASA